MTIHGPVFSNNNSPTHRQLQPWPADLSRLRDASPKGADDAAMIRPLPSTRSRFDVSPIARPHRISHASANRKKLHVPLKDAGKRVRAKGVRATQAGDGLHLSALRFLHEVA
jgi:hypothetical protein